MTTPTQICNQALLSLGGKATLADLATEQSPEARYCRVFYDDTRRATLRAAYWNFARESNYITLLKALPGTPENPTEGSTNWTPDYPPVPWLYEYAYPANCLAMRYITPQWLGGGGITPAIFPESYGQGYNYFSTPSTNPALSGVPFIVASDTVSGQRQTVVLTNLTQAVGVWTIDVELPALWDASFQEAMVAGLAAQLAIPLTGKQELAKEMAKRAIVVLQQAQARDGNEGTTNVDFTPDWLRIRGVGGGNGAWGYTPGWVMPGFLSGY